MESEVYKAQRRTIHIGDIPLEVARLPDGSYLLSQIEVAKIVEKHESSIRSFRASKRVKALQGLSSQFADLRIEGSNKPIAPVSLEIAALYWQKCASEGNAKALALVIALIKRSLYDRADDVFEAETTRQESDRQIQEDLSESGTARIDTLRQRLEFDMSSSMPETPTERELKLKIRLLELELEKERLLAGREKNSYPAAEIEKVGAAPWVVVPRVQKAMGWSDTNATMKLLERLGYGFQSQQWFKLKVVGNLWVMPWSNLTSLSKAIEQFRSEQ